jgi:hypothetical protein
MDYNWQEHPEAILGLIYLYLSYGRDRKRIPQHEIDAFVNRHQDSNRVLDDNRVNAALDAQANIAAGKSGWRGSAIHEEMWRSLTRKFFVP